MEDRGPNDPCVLIVEDCPDTALSMMMLLSAWGYSACVAANIDSAYKQALLWEPAVILLDIGLPGASGWELAKRLRKMPALEATLIVAISGFARDEDHMRSLLVGCDIHLDKPVEPEFLRLLLSMKIQEKRNAHPPPGAATLNGTPVTAVEKHLA